MPLSRTTRWRLRNSFRRIASGVPRDFVSELVDNDLLRAHNSLFTFVGGFGVGRSVLYDADQGPLAGHRFALLGAAKTIVVLPSRRARIFASRHYQAEGLAFVGSVPQEGTYDVIVASDDSSAAVERWRRHLSPGGKIILLVRPAEEWRSDGQRSSRYERLFRVTRRFEHASIAHVDLASPIPSKLSDSAFSFRELLDEESPSSRAITVVYLLTDDEKWSGSRLHLGCGPVSLPGWINIDNQPYAGIDFRWDLARGIPFSRNRRIYAEHFLEHLPYDQAEAFLRRCRECLSDDGVLRLSTPNLDWVWATSYHPAHWSAAEEALRDCFVLNRAFRGWGHQFLYNFVVLRAVLERAGFARVRSHRYGESDIADLAGIEHHDQYPDSPELPHILIAEAQGRRTAAATVEAEPHRSEYLRDVALR